MVRGAGAYICGEESALMESVEGKKGYPRFKPPFPAIIGLWGKPTIINNVETLANVPWIIEHGAKAFAELGAGKTGGTRLFGVSGNVKRPGVYEKPAGYNLKKLIMEDCGGTASGRPVKAVIPGGSSSPVLRGDEIDVSLEPDAIKAAGTMSGSGGVIVMDDSVCMVRALARIAMFYAEESCGQCTPCRQGTPWMWKILEKIERGEGTMKDLALIEQLPGNIMGQTICALGDAAAMPVQSFVKKFRQRVRGAHRGARLQARRRPPGASPASPARRWWAATVTGEVARWAITAEQVLFWVFAIPLMASAAGVVAARNPVYAAMSLVSAFFWLAGIYVLLTAHLLAFVQIIVYAGAIMVLFLFVVMLLSLTDAELGLEKITALKVVGDRRHRRRARPAGDRLRPVRPRAP